MEVYLKYRDKEYPLEILSIGSSVGLFGVIKKNHEYKFYARAHTNLVVQNISRATLKDLKEYLNDLSENYENTYS